MNDGNRLAWAIALVAIVGCGGKVIEGAVDGDGDGGAGKAGASGYAGHGGSSKGGSAGYAGGSGGGAGYAGAGSTMSCAFDMGWPQCDNCVKYNCAPACADCTANADCKAVLNCFTGCGIHNEDCLLACVENQPGGAIQLEKLFDDCVAPMCESQCTVNTGGGGAGGFAGYAGYAGGVAGAAGGPLCQLQVGWPECDQCIGANCLGDCTKCAMNQQCSMLFACLMNCPDEACVNDCASKYPGGIDLVMEVFGEQGCAWMHCQSECGG